MEAADAERLRRAPEPDARTHARTLARTIGNRAFTRIATEPERMLARRPSEPTWGIGCWKRALEHMDRFVDDLRGIEYDSRTARWLANEGRGKGDWAEALFDAWGYCFIAACHARHNPEWTTWLLGHSYDAFATLAHEVWAATAGWAVPSDDRDTTAQDRYNRDVGRSIGRRHSTGDLYQLCFDAMVRGRLDLTAAGVLPRGRALRRRR